MRAGIVAALVVGVTGWVVERSRFGADDAAALARVERELRQRLDESAGTLGAAAARVSVARDAIDAAARDQKAHQRLFDAVDAALVDRDAETMGITIYDAAGTPAAWAGRVSDLPPQRIDGPPALFVAPSALGPRLVRVEPVIDRPPAVQRIATVVVEQSLGTLQGAPGVTDAFVLSTSLVPVTLRAWIGGAPPPGNPFHFLIPAQGGGPLVEADIAQADLASARRQWRRGTWSAGVLVLGLTVLLCAGRVLEIRGRAPTVRAFLAATTGLLALVFLALALLLFAARPLAGSASPTSPLNMLLIALAAAALAGLAIDLVERRRVTRPRPRLHAWSSPGGDVRISLVYGAAGALATALLGTYEQRLQSVVANTSLDVLHFSLHPASANRLAVAFALVLLHAAVIWSAVAIFRAAALMARTPRTVESRLWAAGGAMAGMVGALVLVHRASASILLPPLGVALGAVAVCALVLSRVSGRLHRVSQSARLIVLFCALLAPALAMYPSLFAYATDAKERLVADVYGPQAVSLREDLQRRLQRAVDDIDSVPSLSEFVFGPDVTTPASDRAFVVWSRTELAKYRLTSAVELYSANGRLLSRFSPLPDYAATTTYRAATCAWEQPVEEVSPFGSTERHVLRTGRGICVRGRSVGSVVVRVMLDYQTLPFIASEIPYLESLRPSRQPRSEGISGRDVEFAVYGWSRAPIYESGTSVWTFPDDVFARMVESREPFWAPIERGGETFRVYFLNDRVGIYALGYPVITWFGQLINLAELVTLAFVLYVALLVGATSQTPARGRALLREIRSSFYRKLFLMFVAGAVVPVVILAFATRTYLKTQLSAGAEEDAARTVTTAQRLVEDYAALQQRGPGALSAIDDQIMVLVRRAIDEDVNLFDRDHLQATSARDLFASKLLSARTPGDVYKAILLDRLPTFIREEDVGGYRLAAAPVRAGGRDGIVTVPLTNRQQDIEQQTDDLDRQVLFAVVFFSMLGAALGYWMAERIADPVNRLTRATRRIARGDLDARIAATSSDELRRLVEDFNQMAADLKRQRTELERTQRLEAWADMARQVAHDIKNPLTPIQLSAEHAQRVNLDRGRPLSPVLDECVAAILGQVKLLRQIAAEFSSFASSPTPRPEPTSVAALVNEVVDPYRTGLAGRITIDVEAPPDLPAATIDRTLFARALTNVIENALHAMPGAGRLIVGTHQSPVDRRQPIVVDVTDTGVGMDQEALNKIFEPYFSTKATGTGLGLTIAKRNIELSGGTIAVTSERGIGTTVTMTLPVA